MFCNNCGSEFRNDSQACINCGAKRPFDESELDWEDSARLREQHDADATPLAASKAFAHSDNLTSDGCVRPGAPRKKCSDCGKELPASSISARCALCEIRKRNENASAARKRNDARPAQRYERSYGSDTPPTQPPTQYYSDTQPPTQYYNAEQDQENCQSESAYRAPKSATSTARPRAKMSFSKFILIIIVIFIVFNVFSGVLGFIYMMFTDIFSTPSPDMAIDTSSEVVIASSEYYEDAIYDQIFGEYVYPAADTLLFSVLSSQYTDVIITGLDTSVDHMSIYDDSSYLAGTVLFESEGETYERLFYMGVVFVDDNSFYPLYMELDGEIILDLAIDELQLEEGQAPISFLDYLS